MGISVTDETLERASRVKRLIGRPPGSFALCESEATATKRPVGTEINPSFCSKAILYIN
ncbi:hypothetical protein [Lysinibacillus sp. G4S2]|uniref:hypothetical protein n=1 Tax=Lysinibacillus sp. G4S2 TaxID=3055859 RepID=UPI0025A0E0A7|nr:hypothetical protein [Lysinibacillus sp. G4S2]MDM5250584.1 hypothetical protein [Lysinibacillus sp. G4S2]